MRLRGLLLAFLLILPIPAYVGATPGAATETVGRVRPFEPVHHDHIDLPDGVMPWAANWTPDGRHILFHDYNGGQEWLVDASGANPHCVTCGFKDRPAIVGAFSYAFPDGRRMLVANELGSTVAVLECAPTLADCRSHKYLPVDLSADDAAAQGKPGFARRTYHLAPDGKHLAYSIVRLDALVMVVARLERTETGYRAVDHKVVNPPAATSLLDRDTDRWSNGSQLFEFKSFGDGGRSAIIVGEPHGLNADMLKVDLATGRVTRLTGHPDWDEDGGPSPDGRHLVVASWRGMHRVDPLGVFPYRPFLAYPGFAAVASHYVSSRAGFACDLQPWLLGAEGDVGGTRSGQPLAPYRGGNDIIGNNLAGDAFWSPDSTRVLIQERQLSDVPPGSNDYVQQKGTSPSRLLVARLDREPTRPLPVVSSQVGDWATTPQRYTGAFGVPGTHVVDGKHTGTATVARAGNPAEIAASVAYNRYSDDGDTFISGTEKIAGGVTRGTLRYVVRLRAHDRDGRQIGSLDIDYTFTHKLSNPQPHEPPTTFTGTADARFRGQRAGGIAEAAPCPDDFPRPSRLRPSAEVKPTGGNTARVTVRVSTTILGETRPVRRARVTLLGQHSMTDDTGVAHFQVKRSTQKRTATILARAGDTFDPGVSVVHIPAAGR